MGNKTMNTGRQRYFTTEEYDMYCQYVSDNNGIEATRKKLGIEWNTVNKHIKDKYCSPELYPMLKRKVFKTKKVA
jgi:hypothetical protein